MNLRTTVAAALVALCPTAVWAQSPSATSRGSTEGESVESSSSSKLPSSDVKEGSPPPAGWHRHDGYFMRGHLGVGYHSFSTSTGTSIKATGAGPSFAIAIGGTVVENLIVYGEVVGESAQNPTIEMGSRKVTTNDAMMTLVGIGPGVTYYFMPANVHVGATLLLGKLSLDSNGQTIAQTDWGVGAAARVGKDFWIGKDFGLGVLGQFTFASVKDKGGVAPPTWTGVAASLALAATFN